MIGNTSHPDLDPTSPAPFCVGLRIFLEQQRIGTITEVYWEESVFDWIALVVGPHSTYELVSGDDWMRNDMLLAGNRYHPSLESYSD